MEVGYFLFIRGKVQNRWQKEDDFEVKIQGIEMLSELREKYFNKLTVKVELEKMNRELLDYFVSLGSNKPGNCNVYFDLIDHLENQGLRVMSTKLRVNPNNEVIKELELMGLEPRLN